MKPGKQTSLQLSKTALTYTTIHFYYVQYTYCYLPRMPEHHGNQDITELQDIFHVSHAMNSLNITILRRRKLNTGDVAINSISFSFSNSLHNIPSVFHSV